MITLITGTPGSGKTAWTVQELTRLPTQRKLYVHGIPDLKIAHERIYCRSELCDLCRGVQLEDDFGTGFVEDWPQWASEGSLIVIDEVQRIWRPASASKELPDSISRLETHRHMGLDFWLISQGPHLFHTNIRLLVGRHIHLVAKWSGRTEYEFPECRQNLTNRQDSVSRPYKLPKKVFGLYKSASLHTKQDKRVPTSVYFLAAAFVVALFMGVKTFQNIAGKVNQESQAPLEQASNAAPPLAGRSAATRADPRTAAANLQNGESVPPAFPDFTPTLNGVPESAPAYAELIKVKAAPLLSGCVLDKAKNLCKCYTGQASPYPASLDYCQEVVKGNRFNPYQEPRQPPQQPIQPKPESVTAKNQPQATTPSPETQLSRLGGSMEPSRFDSDSLF